MKKNTSRKSAFGRPIDDLPHLADAFTGPDWKGAEEQIEDPGLPKERFEWFVGTNWSTGQRYIFGWPRPTFKDKLTSRAFWLRVKARCCWRKMRSGGW
jgi:hypothetical protein